ncbi:MAG TPA: hypothetical protein VFF53_07530 [Geobacteraceae bacterium]|nr:hypothetical protein [Geobacteraceae bacterium]
MKKRAISVSRSDIDLCFKALGIPSDATPAQVEQAYAAFIERGRRKTLSADPVLREQAINDMELISDIHFRVIQSVTYADRLNQAAGLDGYTGGFPLIPYTLSFVFGAVLAFGAWYLLI